MNGHEVKQEIGSTKNINLEAFKKGLSIVNYRVDYYDESKAVKLLNLEMDSPITIVDAFNTELHQNLLNWETGQGKTDVISYYINEFSSSQKHFKEFHKILFEGIREYTFRHAIPDVEYTIEGQTMRLSPYEDYIIFCHMLFNEMLWCIHSACIAYDIDFYGICNRLKLNTAIFDTQIMDEFINTTNRSKQPTPAETNMVQQLTAIKPPQQTKISIEQRAKQQQTNQYTLTQIALIYIYKRKNILDPRTDPDRKANSIATSYGFKSPTSGQQLYEKYRLYDSSGNNQRTGAANKKKIIKDIETILPGLKKDAKDRANNELVKLRKSEIEKSEMED